jgi:tetratricopeptide (TPR) repeat protein
MINKYLFLAIIFISISLTSCNYQNNLDKVEEISKQLDIDRIELGNKQLDNIKTQLDSIIKNDPENYKAFIELARFYIKIAYIRTNNDFTVIYDKETLSKAKEALDKSLAINSNYADTYIYYGNYYQGILYYSNAEMNYYKAETLGATNPWLYIRWGGLSLAQQDFPKAKHFYNKAIPLSTNNNSTLGAAYESLARIHERSNNIELANEYYLKTIETSPKNAWIKGSYSEFLRTKIGDADKAILYAEEALNLASYGIGRTIYAKALYAKWARLVQEQDKQEEAELYFEKAYSIYPNLYSIVAFEGHNEGSRYITEALFDNNKISVNTTYEDSGVTFLHEAVLAPYKGYVANEKFVESLLARGISPNVYTSAGRSPLYIAIQHGLLDIVKILVANNADTNLVHMKREKSALDIAKHYQQKEIVDYLNSLN